VKNSSSSLSNPQLATNASRMHGFHHRCTMHNRLLQVLSWRTVGEKGALQRGQASAAQTALKAECEFYVSSD
jgi:hypothetical protein